MKTKNFFYFLTLGLLINSNIYTEDTSSKIDIDITMKKSIVENIINNQLPYTIEDKGAGNQIFTGNKNNILGRGLDMFVALDKKFS